MIAWKELDRLWKKLNDGSLPAEEPLFTLRAQDELAASIVREWAREAFEAGTPQDKIDEANELANAMDQWPIKQTPGRPETKIDRNKQP